MLNKHLDRIEKEFNAERDLIVTDERTWADTLNLASDEWKLKNKAEKLITRVLFIENLNQLVFVKARY